MAVRDDASRYRPEGEVLFLVNAHDRTVNAGPVFDVAKNWRRHAVPVSVYEFPDSLALPHNVMDASAESAATVPPILLSLARTGDAPHWLPRH
jgi:hypothetical protein